MNEYHVKAFAKINLGLDVINKMPNGYHQVKMIMQSISLYDELTLQKTDSGITISTDSDLLPTDQNNLIRKAAEMMYDKHHITSGVHIHLKKNIPIAAGMAGGSTDAAATLKGIDILFDLNIPLSRLAEYAVSIGADVPYCLLGAQPLRKGLENGSHHCRPYRTVISLWPNLILWYPQNLSMNSLMHAPSGILISME